MTRVATPKNEEYLLMIARHGTAYHVERPVRNYRKVKRSEAPAQATIPMRNANSPGLSMMTGIG